MSLDSRLKDLTGHRFGRLIVLSKAPVNVNGVRWNVQCDCGNALSVFGSSLKFQGLDSCGVKCPLGEKVIVVGQRFGRWVTQSKNIDLNRSKKIFWNCICDCGKLGIVAASNLRTDKSRSCGCLARENARTANRSKRFDLTGATSGFLTYQKEADTDGKRRIECLCVCGNSIIVVAHTFIDGKTKSCGCLMRQLATKVIPFGTKFGRLTVKDIDTSLPNGNRGPWYFCSCDCGTQKSVRGRDLRQGTQSCGCFKSDIQRARMKGNSLRADSMIREII